MHAFDRLVTLLLALVLLVAGAALCWWWSGEPVAELGGRAPDLASTSAARDVVAAGWWPWAAGIGGLVFALLGLLWIARHLRRPGVRRLTLGGSDASGRLQVSASRAAGAAATALAAHTHGVRSADGVVVRDRGQLVARLSAVLDPTADLALVARRCDEVSGQLRQVLERDDLRCRVELRVGR
ncbi:hypothetical protein GCM10011519_25310 [Marmoricola endophyticus]|uniref:Alkaline shock response membrane anchor protein AmaP n=2 Tax=Marmoricola endophyticus TaxID=2040280 RepID=A0A917BM99_9ACTN|nr:hypothetical protein GCM10011519_25310 [Marmoricola endophyticus]